MLCNFFWIKAGGVAGYAVACLCLAAELAEAVGHINTTLNGFHICSELRMILLHLLQGGGYLFEHRHSIATVICLTGHVGAEVLAEGAERFLNGRCSMFAYSFNLRLKSSYLGSLNINDRSGGPSVKQVCGEHMSLNRS
jgi:hypothetical protein